MSSRHDGPDPFCSRILAVLMATHARLGDESPLGALDAGVVERIAQLSVTPVVERPIRVFSALDLCDRSRRSGDGDDDFVIKEANDDPLPTPFVCTILDHGVPVFRCLLEDDAERVSYFEYVSRRRGARVHFALALPSRGGDGLGFALADIMEFVSGKMLSTTTGQVWIQEVFPMTLEEAVGFRARNDLGIEMRLSLLSDTSTDEQWTPLIGADD